MGDTLGRGVAPEVNTLISWTTPGDDAGNGTSPSPPKLLFNWGQLQLGAGGGKFFCHLESLTVRYTMFRRDGTPLRAELDVKLTEVHDPTKGQNPTSGGLSAQRVHRLARGDTLQSVAFAEYGDASLWRGLATINGIDDPMRVAPGRELRLPSTTELRGL
jgi:nucleoid-associated protein YgaU